MKTPVARDKPADVARTRLEAWARRGLSYEDIASRVGCSLRSVQNWLGGKRITRLSATAINTAWDNER